MWTASIRPRQLSIRLRISCLQLLARILKTSWFQWWLRRAVVRPLVFALGAWFFWKLFRDPQSLAENAGPQVAQLVATVQAQLDQKVQRYGQDRTLAIDQTMTWGAAGAAVLLLTTMVATHTADVSGEIAAACFALAIPLLTVCGMVLSIQTDPKSEPPTVREVLRAAATLHTAHFILCLGITAMLWSYDPKASCVFVLGCYLALRYFRHVGTRMSRAKSSGSGGPPAAG